MWWTAAALTAVAGPAAAVRSGRLDERLFDATGLIRAGYDDRPSASRR